MRISKTLKPIEVICVDCNTSFIAYTKKAKRCEVCRVRRKKELTKEWHKRESKSCRCVESHLKKAKEKPKKTMKEVLRAMEKYNKEHGTCLSYGQYIQMCEGVK